MLLTRGWAASANPFAAAPTGPSADGGAARATWVFGAAFTASASSLKATKVASASALGIWAYHAAFKSSRSGVASNTALILSAGAAANIFAKAVVTSSWFFRGVTKLGPIASTAFL